MEDIDPYNTDEDENEKEEKQKKQKLLNAQAIAYLKELQMSRGWDIIKEKLQETIDKANNVLSGNDKTDTITDMNEFAKWQDRKSEAVNLRDMPAELIKERAGVVGDDIEFE